MNQQLLKLTILKDRLRWEIFKCGDENSATKIDHSDEKGIPLDRDELRDQTIGLLTELQQLVADLRRSAKRDVGATDAVAGRVVEALGEHLYRFLFRGELLQKLNDSLRDTAKGVFRIELEFQGDALKEYGSWPWEYLRSPMEQGVEGSGEFLALRTQLVLNRRLFLPGQAELKTTRPIVLLVVAGPPGKALSDEFGVVQAETVVTALRDLDTAGVIDLIELVEPAFEPSDKWKPTASWAAFKAAVRDEKRQPDAIHFIGHGQRVYDPNERKGHSELIFVGNGCTPDPHRDTEFVEAVGKGRKLVFLQACESGVPGPYASATSVGQLLAHYGIPAVVAMQTKIENIVANEFAAAFYKALSQHKPVDWAVREGREAIQDLSDLSGTLKTLKLAFGVPVLYLRSYEALISPVAADKVATMAAAAVTAPKVPLPGSRPPMPKAAPFAACPRCGSTRVQNACAKCGLQLVCKPCGEALERDPDAPSSDPMFRFCKACNAENAQRPWNEPVVGEGDRLQEPPPRMQ
jgi:hypothetical protein